MQSFGGDMSVHLSEGQWWRAVYPISGSLYLISCDRLITYTYTDIILYLFISCNILKVESCISFLSSAMCCKGESIGVPGSPTEVMCGAFPNPRTSTRLESWAAQRFLDGSTDGLKACLNS